MKLLQLYYTSCKQGRSAGSGFQVYSASEGLSEAEIMELEQICLYIPPSHLPSQPTAEEISAEFPISFSSFRLKSGRYGICQSVYVGKDYSERFGNYFSHALILEEGEWPFAPILLYGSPYLRTRLTDLELAIDDKPDPLPEIYLQEPNGSITLSFVQNFLKEQNRYHYLHQMLNALIEREGKPESLILAADPKLVPYWIAAIQLSFPEQITNNLSFSTYVYDPSRADYVISVTMDEGTRFSFQDLDRRSNIYGFNFISNQFSEPKKSFRYAEKVVKSQLSIESLKQFSNRFTLNTATSALDQLLDLKILLDSGTNLELERTKDAIQFAENYSSSHKSSPLLDELSPTQLIDLCADIDSATSIANFIIDISNDTKNPTHEELAANFLIEITYFLVSNVSNVAGDRLQVDKITSSLDEITSFLNKQMERMNEPAHIRKLFLQDEQLEILRNILDDMKRTEINAFYLAFFMEMILQEAKDWDDLTKEQQLFMSELSGNIFSQKEVSAKESTIFEKSPALFANISSALYEEVDKAGTAVEKDRFIHNFIIVTENFMALKNWSDTCFHVLNSTENGKNLIEKQFMIRLKNSNQLDKTSKILTTASLVPGLDLSKLVSQYEKQLFQSEQNFLGNIANIMQQEKLYSILDKHNTLLPILDHGQQYIDFSDDSLEKNGHDYEQFITYCHKKGLKNTIYELALVTYEEKQKRRKNVAKLEKVLLANLNDVDEYFSRNVLSSYLTWCLPELIDMIYENKKVESPLIHELVQRRAGILLHILINRRHKLKIKHIDYLLADLFIGCHKNGMNEELYDLMSNYLVEHEPYYKKAYELLIEQPKLQQEWADMYEEIQQNKGNSIVRSIKKIFRPKG